MTWEKIMIKTEDLLKFYSNFINENSYTSKMVEKHHIHIHPYMCVYMMSSFSYTKLKD